MKTRATFYVWTDSTRCVHTCTASRFRELVKWHKDRGLIFETTGLKKVRKTMPGVWK